MSLYKYRAKKGPLDIVEGSIDAQSEKEAIEKISLLGYLPLRVEMADRSAQNNGTVSLVALKDKVKSREITVFSRQLASLLRSGVPILTSLNIIAEQSESPNLKSILRNIHNTVKAGTPFSECLQQYPKVFSPLYLAMIRTGESSGVLPEVLLRIADHRAKEEEAISRFRMAMAYPILMAVVGAGTIIFMLTFVMPRLMNIFITMGQQLPLPTRILISISYGFKQWWLWVGLALVTLVIRRQAKTEAARAAISIFSLRLPLFGKFILKSELARFSRTLELLIKSGIPILRAINVAIPVVDNQVLSDKLKISYKELEQGGSFGRSLKSAKVFPLLMTNLIIVGEESGKLSDALGEVAATYERETDETIKVMTNLLEPLMILFMGLIVGFIVISMLLPIFEINMMAR